MIENKSLGSKIFDILNVVILIAVALICIVPVWYVLCVSLSSREAVNAGQVALWPVGFNLLSYKKIMGETAFFGSFLVSIKRVLLGTGISMVCILMAAFPLSRTKKQFPKRDTLPVQTLSGGNQQKVVLARWLATHPKILILNGPTVGVDIGAKYDIHKLLRELAKGGMAVLVVSDDVAEITALCDRALIMKAGRMTGEFKGEELTDDNLYKSTI